MWGREVRSSAAVFYPSIYSTGVQSVHALGSRPVEGRAYGSAETTYLWDKLTGGGDDDTPSVFREYWWVFLLATPFVYIGVNMALDSSAHTNPLKL